MNPEPNRTGWWRRTFMSPAPAPAPAIHPSPPSDVMFNLTGSDGVAMIQCNRAVWLAALTVDPGPLSPSPSVP